MPKSARRPYEALSPLPLYSPIYLDQQIGAGKAEMALAQIRALRASLGAFLAAALERKLFAEAQLLIQALAAYWDVAGLGSEAAAWGDRTVKATEPHPGQAPEIGTAAHNLWLFVTGTEANRAIFAGDLARAECFYQRVAASLGGNESPSAKHYVAGSYHQLGMAALDRGHVDEAEGWHEKSLTIFEALGDQPNIAASYQELGLVAQLRGRLDDAESWYKKSLAIRTARSDQPGAALSYHQLGVVAQLRGRWTRPKAGTRNRSQSKRALGNQPGMAMSYGQLGTMAGLRGHSRRGRGLVSESPCHLRGDGRSAK